jgi:hypothetical protein
LIVLMNVRVAPDRSKNRLQYVRDTSFREDASRIRCNASIFAEHRATVARSTKGWL